MLALCPNSVAIVAILKWFMNFFPATHFILWLYFMLWNADLISHDDLLLFSSLGIYYKNSSYIYFYYPTTTSINNLHL